MLPGSIKAKWESLQDNILRGAFTKEINVFWFLYLPWVLHRDQSQSALLYDIHQTTNFPGKTKIFSLTVYWLPYITSYL